MVKILGETIPSTLWGSLLSELAAKSCGSPSDPILSRAWLQLSPSIVKSGDAVSALFILVSGILEQQGELTEKMLEAALDASDESLDDLRLARLAPLAILKVPISFLVFHDFEKSVHRTNNTDHFFRVSNIRHFPSNNSKNKYTCQPRKTMSLCLSLNASAGYYVLGN